MYYVRACLTADRFMSRVLSSETPEFIDKEVVVKGWVHVRRDHGKLIFIDLRDRGGLLQIIINPQISEQAYTIAAQLKSEDVVVVQGTINKRPEKLVNPKLKSGTVELEAKEIEVLSKALVLPFDMGGADLKLELPTLLDYRSLTLRHQKVLPIFKVQATIAEAFRDIANKLECVEIFVPTIVASATEGGAEVFELGYYDHKAYLSQSPQLYKQMLVPVFERVFTVAHAYRAEPSFTTRHLSESTQMDCEFGFTQFPELLDLLEEVGTHIVKTVYQKHENILKEFGAEKVHLGKIPRLTLREAQEIIFKETGRDARREDDLAPIDEVDICKWAAKEHNSDFVTITHFPTHKKPFYTMPDPKDSNYSLSYDLLFKGVEILSGSQRINNYQQLAESLNKRGMNPESFGLYLQAFKYGMPPEGGFSFGLERITMKLFGLSNIREASLFPRDMERVDERFSVVGKKDS